MNNSIERDRRVLIIDENGSNHRDIQQILGVQSRGESSLTTPLGFSQSDAGEFNQFVIDTEFDGSDGVQKIAQAQEQRRPYAITFVDMEMSRDWDSIQTVQEIWKAAPEMHVVVCTDSSAQLRERFLQELGVSDRLLFLKKPFDHWEVKQMVMALSRKSHVERIAKESCEKLQQLVRNQNMELNEAQQLDKLTGLPNRSRFMSELRFALKNSTVSGGSVAVIVLDLDDFSCINETMGHSAGDRIVQQFARRLRSTIRKTDFTARLGGDEFAIIQYPVSNPTEVVRLTDRILKTSKQPFQDNDVPISVGLSIGVAFSPEDGMDVEELLNNADLAMRYAKREGRGGCRQFSTEMNARMKTRRRIELKLREAVSNEQLELHYQPIFSTQNRNVVALEALLRWTDPDLGNVPPDVFIPVAEETDVINTLGDWVLKTACQTARQWPQNVRVAINVSPVQLQSGEFADSISRAINESGLAPERLEIEITENSLLRNSETTLSTLHSLREMGVRVVMDDFGTGYSSLSYLRSFPFDKLKIDKSFVGDLGRAEGNEDANAIVCSVATLGQFLKMETTAEGVETERQMEIVVDYGYTQVQGFLLGRPAPASKIMEQYFNTSIPPVEFPPPSNSFALD